FRPMNRPPEKGSQRNQNDQAQPERQAMFEAKAKGDARQGNRGPEKKQEHRADQSSLPEALADEHQDGRAKQNRPHQQRVQSRADKFKSAASPKRSRWDEPEA